VLNFAGELFLEERKDRLLAKYKGDFNPKYFGTGWLFKRVFPRTQKSTFKDLGKAYEDYYAPCIDHCNAI